jgi:hypothetical protein
MQHLINGVITAAIQAAINGNIDSITTAVPFARSRTPQERAHLADMGPKRYAAIVIIYNVMLAHPEIFPSTFDQAKFTESWALIQVLDEIIARLEKLVNLFTDTRKLVASDLYSNGMQAYELEKTADKRGDTSIHDSMVEVADLFSHSLHEPVLVTLPGSGSATVSNLDTTKKLFVTGNGAVSVRNETAPLSSAIQVNPFTAYTVPAVWPVIVVLNLTAAETSFTYKAKL